MERQCHETIWHLGEHAVAVGGKSCIRSQTRTDKPGGFAARVLTMLIIRVRVSGIVPGFAATCCLIDRPDVCCRDFVESLSEANPFASSVFLASHGLGRNYLRRVTGVRILRDALLYECTWHRDLFANRCSVQSHVYLRPRAAVSMHTT